MLSSCVYNQIYLFKVCGVGGVPILPVCFLFTSPHVIWRRV